MPLQWTSHHGRRVRIWAIRENRRRRTSWSDTRDVDSYIVIVGGNDIGFAELSGAP